MTALSIYLLSSLIFVVGALIEFAIVVYINRIISTKKDVVEQKCLEHKQDGGCFCIGGKDANLGSRFRNNINKIRNAVPDPHMETSEIQKTKKNWKLFPALINKLDWLAFWVYFFSYFTFNFVYWYIYLVD